MRGRHQGGQDGSLAGFIIVGVLLALVLVGGIYGLNRYNAQKASEETTASKDDKKTAEDKSKNSDQTAKKDESDKNQPDIPKDNDTSADSSGSNQTAQSSTLPHTGPSDVVTTMVTIALLAFAAAHFVQARRTLS
jgi:cytoskeletal protein RodZ